MNLVEMERTDERFQAVVNTKQWQELQECFKNCTNVMFFGNGGNMSVADHGAIDMCRLTDKNAICPGSGIVTSSIIGDLNFKDWLSEWVTHRLRGLKPEDTVAIGLSCSSSGDSSDSVLQALENLSINGGRSFLLSATQKENVPDGITHISLDVEYYHTSEIIFTMLFYQLIHGAGFACPKISEKSR
jgi:phosphoheptose isomerase